MSSGETAIVTTLETAVALFEANLSTLVPDIYGYETSANQTAIQTWWTDTHDMVIREGYSARPIQGLSWNVTTGPEQEANGRKVIGSNAGISGTTKTLAIGFSSTYVIAVLGMNQDWLRWSQMLCKWALAYYRKTLENTYGLLNQRISLGPLQAVPDDLRDSVKFAFMRTVTLTADHEDTWDELPETAMTSATINVNPTYE